MLGLCWEGGPSFARLRGGRQEGPRQRGNPKGQSGQTSNTQSPPPTRTPSTRSSFNHRPRSPGLTMSLLSLFHPQAPITASELAAILAEREVGILAGPNTLLERHSKSISVAFNKLNSISASLEALAKRVNGKFTPDERSTQPGPEPGWAGSGATNPTWAMAQSDSDHQTSTNSDQGVGSVGSTGESSGSRQVQVDKVIELLLLVLMGNLTRNLQVEAQAAVNRAFDQKLAILNQGFGQWPVSSSSLPLPMSDVTESV